MVIEVPRDKRDVDIARLTDRLAIVERLEHGEQAGMALHQAGQGIEIARPLVAAEFGPIILCRSRGCDSSINIGWSGLSDVAEPLGIGGIERFEAPALGGRAPFTADKKIKTPVMAVQPFFRFARAFRRRAIFHAVEDICGAGHVRPWVGGGVRRSAHQRGARAGVRYL